MRQSKFQKFKGRAVKSAVEWLGYRMYQPNLRWHHDERFLRARNDEIPGIPDERCFVLCSAARAASRLPGDIAECGSRKGRSAWYILASFENLTRRRFHVFDSFAGLREPTAADRQASGKLTWEAGDFASGEELFATNLKRFADTIDIRTGWIPDRFPEVADRRFALVHIDVDLFEATRDSLEFFYERLSPRGIIICDDYGFVECPGVRKAFDDFFERRPESVIEIPTGQAIVVKA
jgi:hypothetical protein